MCHFLPLQVQGLCNVRGQEGPLLQRLRLLESLVAESATNAALAQHSADLYACVKPGTLVVRQEQRRERKGRVLMTHM